MPKYGGKRECPAVDRTISSGECGAKRNAEYRCPSDCPYNPFALANYDQLLEIEERVDHKTTLKLQQDIVESRLIARAFRKADGEEKRVSLHAFVSWRLFFALNGDGDTFAHRWQAEGFSELKNDEKAVMTQKLGVRIALIEVQRVLDHERIEVVDLLAEGGERFLILDRSFASSVPRFFTALVWLYDLPVYSRVHGASVAFPDIRGFSPVEVLKEAVGHLDGPTEKAALRRWLAENLVLVNELLNVVLNARRQAALAHLDSDFYKVTYDLKEPASQCLSVLDGELAVEWDRLSKTEEEEGWTDGRVWLDDGDLEPEELVAGQRVIGRVLLGEQSCRIEGIGGERIRRFRGMFENLLGAMVRFRSEILDDVESRLNGDGDERLDDVSSEIPASLMVNLDKFEMSNSRFPLVDDAVSEREIVNALQKRQDELFLDRANSVLDGKSPREAVHDLLLRPKLVQVMKSRIRSSEKSNPGSQGVSDSDSMLKELGLSELL
ncbi:MAG: hypothetical protein HOI66_09030 [Verrucomicrobia bacterium]|jgi:hypothetical protein|nr:hypothetical protein [Verrucomicrobiota bacterium]